MSRRKPTPRKALTLRARLQSVTMVCEGPRVAVADGVSEAKATKATIVLVTSMGPVSIDVPPSLPDWLFPAGETSDARFEITVRRLRAALRRS